jgi:16S rRNA (guanine527-N7)-methyltransferase
LFLPMRYSVHVEAEQIISLLKPYVGSNELSAEQIDNISTYVNLVMRWNARTNLTAIRDEDAIVRRHFGESLFVAAQLLDRNSELAVADVGSGAGFPGLPLKIFAQGTHLVLIESHGKKATFLREVARALKFKDVTVLEARAEQSSVLADVVTFRAVEKFESILMTAAKLVRPGGRLAMLVGAGQIARAQELLPGSWDEPIAVPESQERALAVWRP